MKKRYSYYLVIFLISLALLFVSGCAKKTVLKEEAAPRETPAVAVQKPAAAEKAKDDAAVRRQAEEERAARERALKAQAEKEAAAAAKVEKEAAAKKAAKAAAPARATFEFADIYFDFDKYALNDEAKAVIAKGAEWLNKSKDVLVTIEGHCDERGTAEYNLALGERRANAVAKYLIDLGVEAKRIKTISYGFERPLDQRHNEEAWQKNRRAHIASGK